MLTQTEALALAREYLERQGVLRNSLRVVTDTTNFFLLDVGDILLLEQSAYLITGHEREGRFGLDDEAKFWVKKAVDLKTGGRKVIKLVFTERFTINIGPLSYDCFRSPAKEARILDLVRGNPVFMQGFGTTDHRGNNVRVIDYIKGPTLNDHVLGLTMDHKDYFHRVLPNLLALFRPALEGIALLHSQGEKHGDIRRDHLLLTPEKRLVWIDFDYNYRHGEYIGGLDLFGLGNVLAFLVGGGDVNINALARSLASSSADLSPGDVNIVFGNRLMNLRKIYPYIPERLNRVLMHFSAGTEVFYDSVGELMDDLDQACRELK